MINVVSRNNYVPVLNLAGIDSMSYYSKQDNQFHVLEWGEKDPRSFVKTPYGEAIEGGAMRYFWLNTLGKSEWWFESNRKFMGYLLKHGLEEDYHEVEKAYVFAYMQAWAADNHITFDWDELEVI